MTLPIAYVHIKCLLKSREDHFIGSVVYSRQRNPRTCRNLTIMPGVPIGTFSLAQQVSSHIAGEKRETCSKSCEGSPTTGLDRSQTYDALVPEGFLPEMMKHYVADFTVRLQGVFIWKDVTPTKA